MRTMSAPRMCCALWSYRESGGIRQDHLVLIPFHLVCDNSARSQPQSAHGKAPAERKASTRLTSHQQRHYRLSSSLGQPERSGTSGTTQPGHAFEHKGTNPGDMGGTEGEIFHHLFVHQPVCPVPQHHSSLLLVSSGAGRQADGGTLVPLELKAAALLAALGTLHHPQSLCQLGPGWVFKRKTPALSEWAGTAWVSVQQLIPLSGNLQPRRQRISYS